MAIGMAFLCDGLCHLQIGLQLTSLQEMGIHRKSLVVPHAFGGE